MRVLALIAARGGSKRLPGKNLRKLGGVPLIVWSIDIAKGIDTICDILVSTDAPSIAEVARDAGALVPWLRPAELATDTATSVDVCLHALDWYERNTGRVDGLMLLQPTSPFRKQETLFRGLELFRNHEYRAVIGVAPAKSHPMWCFKITEQTLRPFLDGEGMQFRSQDLPSAYVISGAFYLISPDDLRNRRSFCHDDMLPLIIDQPEESLDIDNEWDWSIAESVLQLNPGIRSGLRKP